MHIFSIGMEFQYNNKSTGSKRIVGKISVLLPLLLLALAMGCAGEKSGSGGTGAGAGTADNSSFSFPRTPVDYTARYVINEGGSEAAKLVFASGNRMRIQLDDGGSGYFALFFLGKNAYSCANPAGNASCFDISGRAQVKPEDVLPCQHLEGSTPAEKVDIGSTVGNCHVLPYGVFSTRKICCTDRGVLAYDEYNLTNGKAHVEYLTGISYSVNEEDFLLPATPKNAPDE